MPEYRAIFFDLDHTLWDYERNAFEALSDLYREYTIGGKIQAPVNDFFNAFSKINHSLWDQYDSGKITRQVIRDERFQLVLAEFGVSDSVLATELSEKYLTTAPKKSNLIAGAQEILNYLSGSYKLYIITNGFQEIQHTKLKSGQIEHYFDEVFISDAVGHKKPSKEIFEHVLNKHSLNKTESIMIGDNLLTDIAGAINTGIDSVFYNPGKLTHEVPVTYEISHLSALKEIL
jgi:YjjG family noncanonical pyrimidine nucleotidase